MKGRHSHISLAPCRLCITGLSVLILAFAGCTSLPPAERQALQRAAGMYQSGDLRAATADLDRLIKDYDQAIEISEAYYLRGLCRLKSKLPREAEQDFERAIQKSQRTDLTARCRASLAAIAYQAGNWARASDLYVQALPELPDQPPKDKMLYCAGIALQRNGQWREAVFQFGQILRKFRDSPMAADARRLASWRHDYFAIQLAAFSGADSAESKVQELRAKGFDAVQEFLPRNNQSLWVVMAGRYPTYGEAVQGLNRVKRSYPDAFIIP